MAGLIMPWSVGMMGGKKPVAQLNYISQTFSLTNTSSYTFASQTVGSSSEPHHVIIGISAKASGTSAISSVSIAGQSCSLVAARNQGGNGDRQYLYITSSEITATSGTVSVAFTASHIHMGVQLVELVGLESRVPLDTYAVGGVKSASDTLTTQKGGVAIGFFGDCFDNAISNISWTGVSDLASQTWFESSRNVMEIAGAQTTGSTLAITSSTPSSATYFQMGHIYASFR